MTSTHLLTITAIAYFLSAALYIVAFVSRASKLAKAATAVTVIAVLLNTAGIGWRWYEYHVVGTGYFPANFLYEDLALFSWSVAIFALGLEKVHKNRTLPAFVMPFAFGGLALGTWYPGMPHEVKPLAPMFQSNWLTVNVAANFLGNAAFAVVCGMGVMRLLKSWHQAWTGEKPATGPLAALPALTVIDSIVLQALVFGVLLMAGGVIASMIWSFTMWGSFGDWSINGIWLLICLAFYCVVLLIRWTKGVGGWVQSFAYMLGFGMIYFGYFLLVPLLRSL